MKKRKINKKERKARRAASRQQRAASEPRPIVTVRSVGEDITVEEVAEIFADGEIFIDPELLEHLGWND